MISLKSALAGATVAGAMVCAAVSAQAVEVFSQGFEVDTAGWSDGGDFGAITRLDGATAGVTPLEGGFVARFEQSSFGPFTFFDGARDVFPGTYTARAAVFLDTNWVAGSGFDYSVASNGTDGVHQRDFIFHVTQDTSTGSLLVGGSNNTDFDPKETLETGNHVVVTDSDWYIFEHVFRDDGGVLAVDLNLRDALGVLLFTETRSNAGDTIPGEVGGNRYGWFTNIDVAGGVLVDATSLDVPQAVPVPAALPLMAVGVGVFGLIGLRRRRAI